nr:tRNA pseudouridine(55) synthase TruB [Leucobacter exalbidus]
MSEPVQLPPQGGILFVDKSEGWTSHDAVSKTRRALGTRKVGHAGTLDPMATGLLVLGVGPATRLLTHLVGLDKCYTTTIRLGISTVTDDREGDRVEIADEALVTEVAADLERITAGIARLTGPIEQSPSAVSAIKVDGQRAYDRVRAGEQFELKARPVTIHAFEAGAPKLTRTEDGIAVIDIEATVRCSTGTYIRALARDLGADLGIGGHLIELRRTEVGPFSLEGSTLFDELLDRKVRALETPTDIARKLFPILVLTDDEARDMGHGKRLEIDTERCADAALVAAVAGDDRLVGLVEVKRGRTRVITNFPTQGNAA